jgi:YesN/AraC family two-component response regulator
MQSMVRIVYLAGSSLNDLSRNTVAVPVAMSVTRTHGMTCRCASVAMYSTFSPRLADGKCHGILATADEHGMPHLRWMATLSLDDFPLLFHSKVLSREQGEAVVQMLEISAQPLTVMAKQILVEQQNEETPLITKAKRFIGEHQSETLSLDQMARTLNVSTFHFCKIFKKATGLTFTDYLARTRIERAKNLLLNPNFRVSEVAYACGFISLTHFNRVFKRLVRKSPTEYRRTLRS